MTVRAVEWKKPYTWWKAIEITEDKVINLKLRDENNLIIWDEWDNEIYVDLQLPDEIRPTDAFPVWVNTGRVIVDNWWDVSWTILVFKTTSGDNVKFLYWDDWKLYIDNGTWSFKQIYVKWEVDALLALKQDLLTAGDWISIDANNVISSVAIAIFSATAPSNPVEWMLWYDTTNQAMKVYDGTNQTWIAIGWSSPTPPTPTGWYRYIKWHITATENTDLYNTQVSEFKFTDGTNAFARPTGTTATCNATSIYTREEPSALLDGDVTTKMYVERQNASTPYDPIDVVIDLGSGNSLDTSVYTEYEWYTANDSPERDPVSWTIELSEDWTTWETWSTVTNATITTTRETLAGTWQLTDPNNL